MWHKKYERVSLTIQQQAFIRWLILIQWMHWFYFTKMSQMHAFFKRGAEPFNVNEIKLHIKQIDFNYLFRTINFNYHFLLFQPTFCQYAHIFSVQFILGVFKIELTIKFSLKSHEHGFVHGWVDLWYNLIKCNKMQIRITFPVSK